MLNEYKQRPEKAKSPDWGRAGYNSHRRVWNFRNSITMRVVLPRKLWRIREWHYHECCDGPRNGITIKVMTDWRVVLPLKLRRIKIWHATSAMTEQEMVWSFMSGRNKRWYATFAKVGQGNDIAIKATDGYKHGIPLLLWRKTIWHYSKSQIELGNGSTTKAQTD
jgi:hypothetical protein